MTTPVCGLDDLRFLLKKKRIYLSTEEIAHKLEEIAQAQKIFPDLDQQASLIQLLLQYERSKRKVIILIDEKEEKRIPSIIHLSVLAEDWRGMSNSILGIIHQREGNVLNFRAITFPFAEKTVAIVILAFILNTIEDYNRFLVEKNHLIALIREASLGSQSKTLLLEDETIKFELYNQTINRIKKTYKSPDIDNIISENGEAIKFFSSRSREYLEERSNSDLADIIIDNYRFQKMIKGGLAAKMIRIKNFQTQYENLTGITFVCRKEDFSIENFLNTLEFLVPNHIIKHHKSFVNRDSLLVYRIEIVDSEENPLDPQIIKKIEFSLNKQIGSTSSEEFSQFKTIGGFEHYARAIIPFLMDESQQTGITQVFMDSHKTSEFLMDIKLLVVHRQTRKRFLNQLIQKIEKHPSILIYSVIPPRIYRTNIEVNILNLRVTLSDFSSPASIFSELKAIMKEVFPVIRDFDEGLREKDMRNLMELKENLSKVPLPLLKEIYFNFDEIYRIEVLTPVLAEIIRLCCETIHAVEKNQNQSMIINYKNIHDPILNKPNKTVFVITTQKSGNVITPLIRQFDAIQFYFTRFEWKHRTYMVMTLKKQTGSLSGEEIDKMLAFVTKKQKNCLVIDETHPQPDPLC